MLSLSDIKKSPELLQKIDWEITPRQAFEAYQLKSPGNERDRGLEEVFYFYLSSWRGEGKIVLTKRTYRDSETLAEITPPADLVEPALKAGEGEDMPRGQLPLKGELRAWLLAKLGQ
jgi:hypothetical protein